MFKKGLKGCVAALFLATSSISYSGLPTADLPNLGAQILETLREMLEHTELIGMYDQAMEYQSVLAELGIDGKNNAYSNLIIRQNQQKTDVHNKKILRQSMPAMKSCEVLLSASLNDICISLDKQVEMEDDDLLYDDPIVAKKKRASGKPTKTKVDLMKAIISRAKLSRPKQFEPSNIAENKDNDYNKPFALNPQYLMSPVGATLTLSAEEEVAIKDYIDLIAPPYVASYRDEHLRRTNDGLLIANMVEKTAKTFPRQILQKLLSKRMAGNSGLSELQSLQIFSEEHFSGPGTMDTVAAKISLSNLASPTVIWRNMAVIKAFRVHMSIEKYKSSLNQEAIDAISLGMKLRDSAR